MENEDGNLLKKKNWKKKNNMKHNWNKVFSSTNYFKIQIIKGLLSKNQIPAIIMNKQDSSYNLFGDIELYVKSQDMNNAKKLIGLKSNE